MVIMSFIKNYKEKEKEFFQKYNVKLRKYELLINGWSEEPFNSCSKGENQEKKTTKICVNREINCFTWTSKNIIETSLSWLGGRGHV